MVRRQIVIIILIVPKSEGLGEKGDVIAALSRAPREERRFKQYDRFKSSSLFYSFVYIGSFAEIDSSVLRRPGRTWWIKRIVIARSRRNRKSGFVVGRVARELGSLSLYSHYNLIRIFRCLVGQPRKYEAVYLCPTLHHRVSSHPACFAALKDPITLRAKKFL